MMSKHFLRSASRRRGGRFAGAGLVSLAALLAASEARAEDSGLERRAEGLEDLPPWSLRLGFGGGVPLASSQADLLSAEGYSGPRWAFTGEVERRVYGSLGLGARVIYGWRSLEPSLREGATSFGGGAPTVTYTERDWIGAAEAPFDFLIGRAGGRNDTRIELSLVPWLGVGFGNVDLYDDSSWRAGLAFGGEARLFFRSRHGGGGFSVGGYTLRLPPPSVLAGPVDLGVVLFSAIGGFDVG
jgi:hypothetical protein